jgi:hemolysin activation/secretion protein
MLAAATFAFCSVFETAQSQTAQSQTSAAPALRALVLGDDPRDVAAPATEAVDLSHLHVGDAAGLRAALTNLLSSPITPPTLGEIRRVVIEHFRGEGHPFLDVGFPPQDVTEGTLRVVVTEYRVGALKTEGNAWFADGFITRQSGLTLGQAIDKDALDRRIAGLNANPFLTVTPEFQPAAQAGTTGVTLRAADRFPVDVSAGYSNTGSPTTGWDRWNLGVAWGDAFHLGQTLTYQFSSSSDFWGHLFQHGPEGENPNFLGHAVSWQAPLPWGDSLTVSFGYQRQVPDLGPSLGSIGITTTAGVQYVVPLAGPPPGFPAEGASQQISFGYDYKHTNNDLSFGGETVQQGFTDVSEFSVHYTASGRTTWGQTLIDDTLELSPGGMTPRNTTAAFQPSGTAQSGTPGANARYVYDRLSVTQLVPLPRDFGLVLRASGQLASTTLLPIEQFSIAGMDAVRGYQEFGVSGSNGLLTSIELRGPAYSLKQWLHVIGGPDDRAQADIFFDQGEAWNPTASSVAPGYSHTASLGLGWRYQYGRYFSLRAEEGFELVRNERQGAHGAFLHLAVTAVW